MDEQLLQVTRTNVLAKADSLLLKHQKVPTLSELRAFFVTPASPGIAVYFSEWKGLNNSKIANLRQTKHQWQKYAEQQDERLQQAEVAITALTNTLSALTAYLQQSQPCVWEAWQDFCEREGI